MLRVRDRPGAAIIGLIDMTARYALSAGFHTVVEGILYADRYGAMLEGFVRDYRGTTCCYCLGVPLQDAFVRHGTKLAQYRGRSPMSTDVSGSANGTCCPGGIETVIGASSALTPPWTASGVRPAWTGCRRSTPELWVSAAPRCSSSGLPVVP
ncbi:hypothetical protein ABT404_03555 [Streptomyces hyaluromycini]|uniref:Uncharacterized protein n=1 Tax=Streptomyces hyaluromycini TaxID=1377993 RepID=A0ABV1WNY3_9ACTN